MTRTCIASCLLILAFVACGDELAPGELAITVYGEDYIEQSIPADAFSDGWSVSFDQFLVSLGQIEVYAGHTAEPAMAVESFAVFDLARDSGAAGHAIAAAEVPGGLHDHVNYVVAAAADAGAGNVTQAEVDFMIGGGYAVWVAGTASGQGVTKSFAWGFTATTRYQHCNPDALVDGGPASIELTLHGDHLFYDDLVASDPNLAFQLIAGADSDGDDVITAQELAALDIRAEDRYQTGSLDIDNLWDFIDQQVSTIGHIEGEGHCDLINRE